MSFIRNIWYVAAWSTELQDRKPIARTIIDEPIALYRKTDGTVVAMEDRCAHRHAPLSLGRVEEDDLRCMYHGLKFGPDGSCKLVPSSSIIPPNSKVRTFPAVERWSWIWVWLGDPLLADDSLIPAAWGLTNPNWTLQADALDYAADYQLINDNLCDLSHVDYTHEASLGAAIGVCWSDHPPKVTQVENGLQIDRWFENRPNPIVNQQVDTWDSYRYILPGLFLQYVADFPTGTAKACNFDPPVGVTPVFELVDQQAATPTAKNRARYLFATGFGSKYVGPEFVTAALNLAATAFKEDREMIEGQQAIWDMTPSERPKAFIPQDKAPSMFRRMIAKRIQQEQKIGASETSTDKVLDLSPS